MALETLVVVEDYSALNILRESQLVTAMTSIEAWAVKTNDNLTQLALDIFGSGYEYNNDGVATEVTALTDAVAKVSDNETIDGSWTFTGTTGFSNTVSFSGLANGSIQPRARAYLPTTNQSISDATATAISLTAESYDIGTMHDNGTNPSRITIPSGTSGSYQIVGQVEFDANATGRREVYIYKNGSLVAKNQAIAADGSINTTLQVTVQDNASAGDYYELYAYQNSTGALDVVFGEFKTFLQAMKVW